MIKRHRLLFFVLIISIFAGACGTRSSPTSEVTIPALPTTQVYENTAPAPVETVSQNSLSELAVGLEGLEFDAFVEASYRRLLSRNPETVLVLGLSREYGTPTDKLTDISDEYIRQTQSLEADIIYLLQQFDSSVLTPDQQITFDIYSWYLDDKVKGHEFMYDDYPVNPTVFSVHLDLLQFFTDEIPIQP